METEFYNWAEESGADTVTKLAKRLSLVKNFSMITKTRDTLPRNTPINKVGIYNNFIKNVEGNRNLIFDTNHDRRNYPYSKVTAIDNKRCAYFDPSRILLKTGY
jgi:hypothetical protein